MFAKVHSPAEKTRVSARRKPAKLPEPDGPVSEYVCTVRQDSPFEGLTLLGIDFPKRVFPREAHLLENQGKYYEPRQLARDLAENQVAALKARASETEMRWRGPDGLFRTGFASDFLVLCRPEEFVRISSAVQLSAPAVHPKQAEFDAASAPKPEDEDVREALYAAQRKRK